MARMAELLRAHLIRRRDVQVLICVGIAIATWTWSDRIAMAQALPPIQGLEGPETTAPERQSVGQRPRPDYDALGTRMGSFIFLPGVDLTGAYNSNIFVTQSNTVSDWYTSLRPAFSIGSDWENNAINFHTDGEIRRYATQVSENESNFEAATNGRLDIQRDVYLTGGLGYALGHEDMTSPATVATQKAPTLYQVASAEANFVHETGIVGARLDGAINSYNYNQNVRGDGTTIPETWRDRVEYTVAPRLSYEFIPGYHAYVKSLVNLREYNAPVENSTGVPGTGFKQSSHGYEVDAGTTVGLGEVVNGDVYVGYFKQDYDDARLASPSGVTFGGHVLWNVTQLDSIRGTLARSVVETTVLPASSTVNTDVNLTEEHELLRNVIISANLGYSNQVYQGINRTDDIYSGGIGARYLVNRYLSTGLNATYGERDSTQSVNNYKQTIVLANVHLQY